MFAPHPAKTQEEYIASLEEPQQRYIRELDALIRKTVPKLRPLMQSGMMGYGQFHYKSKSGREGDWPVIAMASRKNYISIYICATDGKRYLAETYKAKFPKANVGKSCIRFKTPADIDRAVLVEILQKAETAPQLL